MLKILSKLCSQHSMVSIYTNSDTNRFHFGIIIAVNDREIAIHMISPDGEDDGIIVLDVDNVFRVEEKGEYLKKMQKLCSTEVIPTYNLNIIDDDIQKSVILYAFNKKGILSIELLDSGYDDVVGFVESIDESECKIRQIDEYGYEDGFSYVDISKITKVTVMSQSEKRIQKLWELNQ